MTQNGSTLAALEETRLPQMNPDDIVIMVMGVTGSGKSSFVQLLVDEDVDVGHSLEPCTVNVGLYVYRDQREQTVYLIDTPGFNDAKKTDAEILKEISFTLVALHKQGISITGIAYLHNITDKRMSGSSLQALKTFKAMCGKQSYPHVTLVTNMASVHSSSSAEEANVGRLVAHAEWWGDMITNGSRITKHTGTADSAKKILELLITARDKSLLLTIQKELVDDGLDLDNTSAGRELDKEIRQAVERLQADMKRLREEVQEAQDADMKRAIEEQRKELQKQIDQAYESQKSMSITLEKLAEEKVEEERKRLDDLVKWETQRDKLKAEQKQNEDAHLSEKKRLLQELEKRPHQSDMARLEERVKHMEIQHKEDKAKDEKALHDLEEKIRKGKKQTSNGKRWRLFQVCVGVAAIASAIVTLDPALAMSGVSRVGQGLSGANGDDGDDGDDGDGGGGGGDGVDGGGDA